MTYRVYVYHSISNVSRMFFQEKDSPVGNLTMNLNCKKEYQSINNSATNWKIFILFTITMQWHKLWSTVPTPYVLLAEVDALQATQKLRNLLFSRDYINIYVYLCLYIYINLLRRFIEISHYWSLLRNIIHIYMYVMCMFTFFAGILVVPLSMIKPI